MSYRLKQSKCPLRGNNKQFIMRKFGSYKLSVIGKTENPHTFLAYITEVMQEYQLNWQSKNKKMLEEKQK